MSHTMNWYKINQNLEHLKISDHSEDLNRLKISDDSEDCEFFVNNSGCFYKRCKVGKLFSDYSRAFKEEYNAMEKIKQKFPNNTYFPTYIGYGKLDDAPCICMEYIDHKTLEEYLIQSSEAYNITSSPSFQFLESKYRNKILQQLYDAVDILYKCDILNFDITPANIIILNSDFDIKLIDFTFFYDLKKTDEYNQFLSYKRNDSRLLQSHPVSLRIANALLFFYIQSFYPSKKIYLEHTRNRNSIYNFFSNAISEECANLLRTIHFKKEDIPAMEWNQYENPPSNNHLFLMKKYLDELTRYTSDI